MLFSVISDIGIGDLKQKGQNRSDAANRQKAENELNHGSLDKPKKFGNETSKRRFWLFKF
jgi:hypothetical protein